MLNYPAAAGDLRAHSLSRNEDHGASKSSLKRTKYSPTATLRDAENRALFLQRQADAVQHRLGHARRQIRALEAARQAREARFVRTLEQKMNVAQEEEE